MHLLHQGYRSSQLADNWVQLRAADTLGIKSGELRVITF